MTVHSSTNGQDPPPLPSNPPLMDDDDDDSFEFFSLRRSPPAMCAADDVFLAGKLLPFVAPPPLSPPPPPPPPPSKSAETHMDHPPQENAPEAAQPSRRFWAGRGGVGKANYRRLRPVSDSVDVATKAAETTRQRPRWYLFVLGSMRVPPTMDLSDIRSRQQRRRCAPAEAPDSPGDANRGTWKLLRSLSCKGLESAGVAVTFDRDLQGV